MNFLGKKVAFLGEFTDFREADFKITEMEFLISQLGGIIVPPTKAEIMIVGANPDITKVNEAKIKLLPIIEIEDLEMKVMEDESKIENNPEILKEIQKYLVEESPKYVGRGIIDENINEFFKSKISQKVSKAWIKQFYENIFIVSIEKEEMVAKFGSPKAKEYALDWILSNDSIEIFKNKKTLKTRIELKLQNDETVVVEDIKKLLKAAYSKQELKLSDLRYIQFLPKNPREELSEWLAEELRKTRIEIIEKINKHVENINSNSTFFNEIKYIRDKEIISELLNNESKLEEVRSDFKNEKNFEYISSSSRKIFKIEHISKYIEIDSDILFCQLQKCGYVKNRYDSLEEIKKTIHSFKFVDREFVKKLVSIIGKRLVFFDEFFNDKEVVLNAVKSYGLALQFANYNFQNDKEVVLNAVKSMAKSLKYASEELKSDREVFENAILCGYWNIIPINEVPNKLREDKELMELMIKKLHTHSEPNNHYWFKMNHFEYISEDLRGDREYILNIMREMKCPSFEFFDSLSMELKKDKEILKEFVTKVGCDYKKLDDESKKDKELTMLAFKSFPTSLYFADISLKGNEEFMIEAFKANKEALKYIKKSLLENGEIIEKICKIDGSVLREFDKEFQIKFLSNRENVLEAIKSYDGLLENQYLPKEFKEDKEILSIIPLKNRKEITNANDYDFDDRNEVLEAVKEDGKNYLKIGEKFRKDREIIIASLSSKGYMLEYIPEELKSDKEIVFTATKQDNFAFCLAAEELKENKSVVMEALDYGDEFLHELWLEGNLLIEDKDIVKKAITKSILILEMTSEELSSDPEIILEAIKYDGQALDYAKEDLRNNPEIIAIAKKNGYREN